MRWPTVKEGAAIAAGVAVVVAVLAVTLVAGDGDEQTTTASPPHVTTAPTDTAPSTSDTTAAPTTHRAPGSPTTTPPTTPGVTPTPSPAPAPAVAIRRGDPDTMTVYLTFDAGSDTGYTAEVLDTLAANRIRATFGITGRWAEANPALVRRMAAEGHLLVNHTYDHPSFTGLSTGEPALSRPERLDQLARADAAIQATGVATTVPWFRPPYGDEDASVRADVAGAGYRYELLWTVDSLGWQGLAADSVLQRCLDQAVPGAIYLFHVGAASSDHAALQRIIDGLTARGYSFATAAALV
jgi:peptidoglycan/xylan/chitin deacetylase (PgdA/CDA1 family)